jgi:hypothetical protein
MIKDPVMLERFQEISNLPEEDKKCIYSLLDAYLAKNKLKALIKYKARIDPGFCL